MTYNEMILTVVAGVFACWAGFVTAHAKEKIRQYKEKVSYYQQPDTQVKIAQHVVKNNWLQNGQEVFK
ncbi:hypothetical protein [Streptococcus himalayensis]|uniref:Uncharacterized protein n=1 Tax=Streptococcus himalayensis TaxID=1888195 RepID=A0A917A4B7_9STRE|nr:hypothetical protein [Streptococcus himalayensis]QBX25389.1 hypothetical protein Javan254_0034 [Streptococcus phage Javan254]GGE26454.1 hypothetical protein GCM10011510_04550 [Streptococcus himalayensis]